MEISKKNLKLICVIFGILVLIMGLVRFSTKNQEIDTYVMFLFSVNGIIWFVLLMREIINKAYSLQIMHWFFCLFFFSLAPMIQYFIGDFPWIHYRKDAVLIKANYFLLLWTIMFELGAYFAKHYRVKRKRKLSREWVPNDYVFGVLLIINIANMLYKVSNTGIQNILSRATNTTVMYASTGTVSSVISGTLCGMCFFSVALSMVDYKKSGRLFWLVFNVICLVVTYFPLGLSRNAVAVIYLGLLLIWFDNFKTNRWFILIFILGFEVILPFLGAFRFNGIKDVSISRAMLESITNIIQNLANNDYDAYTQFTLTLDYVSEYGVGGMHLITDILYWIPRAIWKNKAYSGSYEIAHVYNLFDNVSFPLPAIGYMDLGLFGLCLFGLVVGIIVTKVDIYYWTNINKENTSKRWIDYLYPVVLLYGFFIFRGDMYYIWGYLMNYVYAWIIICIIKKMTYRKQYIKYGNK